jgi:hypothetical protein
MKPLKEAIDEAIAEYQSGKVQPEEFCDGIREILEQYESTNL